MEHKRRGEKPQEGKGKRSVCSDPVSAYWLVERPAELTSSRLRSVPVWLLSTGFQSSLFCSHSADAELIASTNRSMTVEVDLEQLFTVNVDTMLILQSRDYLVGFDIYHFTG